MFLDVIGRLVGNMSGKTPNVIHAMVGSNLPDDDEGNLIYSSRQFEGTITVYTDDEGGFAGFTISGLIPKEGE